MLEAAASQPAATSAAGSLRLDRPSEGSSGGSGGSKGGSGNSNGGNNGPKDTGEANNSYIFKQVYAKLKNGWTTVQLEKALDQQHAAGKISDYEWEQSNKAISVYAASQRRHG